LPAGDPDITTHAEPRRIRVATCIHVTDARFRAGAKTVFHYTLTGKKGGVRNGQGEPNYARQAVPR
jgi:hypothetical protein